MLIFNFLDDKVKSKSSKYRLICLPFSIILFHVKKLSAVEKRVLRTMGSRGGKEAAASLTPAQRKERAQKAAHARWGKRKGSN
jgi:hypothetical protein